MLMLWVVQVRVSSGVYQCYEYVNAVGNVIGIVNVNATAIVCVVETEGARMMQMTIMRGC